LLLEDLCNGFPQYQKEDAAGEWLVMNKDGKWAVKNTEEKDDNGESCHCYCAKKGLPLPNMAQEWSVHDGSRHVVQFRVVVSAPV